MDKYSFKTKEEARDFYLRALYKENCQYTLNKVKKPIFSGWQGRVVSVVTFFPNVLILTAKHLILEIGVRFSKDKLFKRKLILKNKLVYSELAQLLAFQSFFSSKGGKRLVSTHNVVDPRHAKFTLAKPFQLLRKKVNPYPQGGVCYGMAVNFLYMLQPDSDKLSEKKVMQAAKVYKNGATKAAILTQNFQLIKKEDPSRVYLSKKSKKLGDVLKNLKPGLYKVFQPAHALALVKFKTGDFYFLNPSFGLDRYEKGKESDLEWDLRLGAIDQLTTVKKRYASRLQQANISGKSKIKLLDLFSLIREGKVKKNQIAHEVKKRLKGVETPEEIKDLTLYIQDSIKYIQLRVCLQPFTGLA